ncbi:MAG TPA: hypothetical protein VMH83_06615 [Candidatus Acidoferrum sp.]|nr:hypothetical protein [Candidatus Acidoferrum sp.]
MLFTYMQDVQRLLREQRQTFENPDDLIKYINRARREIAMRAQCIRVLTPISGSITGWTVTQQGSGYSASPTCVVSAPDFPSGYLPSPNGVQATATATVGGGMITGVTSVVEGAGYFQPVLTITDPTGTGAEATPTLTWLNELNQGQETYPYSSIDLSGNPGCSAVYYVRGVSIIYSNYRYSLPQYPFSVYQSMVRQYPFQYQYIPTFFTQFGQGTQGTLLLYPLPSQSYQVEWDCQVLPNDLATDTDIEALPMPWQDAVMFYATHLAFLELQNYNAAKAMLDMYEKFALNYSQYARVGRATNPYGRW